MPHRPPVSAPETSLPEGGLSVPSGPSAEAPRCGTCGRPVTRDEIAVTRKLINRGAVRFYCVPCLAAYFEVRPEDILERIAYFRASGCTLFDPE